MFILILNSLRSLLITALDCFPPSNAFLWHDSELLYIMVWLSKISWKKYFIREVYCILVHNRMAYMLIHSQVVILNLIILICLQANWCIQYIMWKQQNGSTKLLPTTLQSNLASTEKKKTPYNWTQTLPALCQRRSGNITICNKRG